MKRYWKFQPDIIGVLLCAFASVQVFIGCSTASAGDGVVSYLPPEFEIQARGPIGLFYHDDRLFVPDPIDNEIIIFNRESVQIGALDGPDGFDFDDALLEGSKLLLFDKRGAGQSIDLSAATRNSSRSLDGNEFAAVRGNYAQRLLGQLDKNAEGLGQISGNAGRALDQSKLDIGAFLKSALPDRTIDAPELIAITQDEKVIATWLEAKGSSIETYVAIFGEGGDLKGIARVTQDRDFVPNAGFVVDESGEVFVLLRSSEGPNAFVPRKVEFTSNRLIDPRGNGRRDGMQKRTDADLEHLESEFDSFVRSLDPEASARTLPRALPGISRADARTRMFAFVNHQWVLKAQNYSRAEIPGNCKPDKYWRRPPRLDNQLEKEVIGIPYRWGGYFLNLESYDKRLGQGYLAGDVCTCRKSSLGYCIVPRARGLDCSGAVSSAWMVSYHGTSTMKRITNPVSWKDLKEADALNKAGSHIMLFVEYVGFGGSHARIVHSSLGCGGVCEKIYSVKKLKTEGYKPIRYKAIMD